VFPLASLVAVRTPPIGVRDVFESMPLPLIGGSSPWTVCWPRACRRSRGVLGVDITKGELERRRAQAGTTQAVQRYEQARDVITAPQRQLLPAGPPVLPQVRVAASYLMAGAMTRPAGTGSSPCRCPAGGWRWWSAAMGQLRANRLESALPFRAAWYTRG
jgi:hypothetical protein